MHWPACPTISGSTCWSALTALLLGLLVSLPLAHHGHAAAGLRSALMTTASVIQTIPGLALLALFYPLLLALSGLTGMLFGAEFSALGISAISTGADALFSVCRSCATR